MKNFRDKAAWVYPGTAQFIRITPIISVTGKATYGFKIWPVGLHSCVPSAQNTIRNFREKGAWAYPVTVQFFQ